MIDLVRDLATFLTREPRSVDDIAAVLGPVRRDPSPHAPIELAPRDAALTGARVSRADGSPDTVELLLAVPLAVTNLRAAFGDFQVSHFKSDPSLPWTLRFERAVQGDAGDVTLLVDATGDLKHLDTSTTTRVRLRLDPKP